jgi:type VI protein secretion system component Hcp
MLCPGMIQLESFRLASFAVVSHNVKEEGKEARDAWSFKARRPGARDETAPALSFSITKKLDTSTPDLFLNYFQSGTSKLIMFPQALVYVRYPKPQMTSVDADSILVFQFGNLYVCQYSMEFEVAEAEAVRPVETVQFTFESYRITFRDQSGLTGPTSRPRALGWDFVRRCAV